MTSENTWENQEWIYSAKKIIEWMATVPQDQPLMFLVRHSHRETLKDYDAMTYGGLTELGKNMSFELGKRIPRKGKMHIYTSFVPRAAETAESIAEGFTQQGGEVIDIDPLPSLASPQVNEVEFWMNLHPDGGNITDLVNNWVNGNYGEQIEPFDDYRNRLLGDTVKRLISQEENIMHVHTTHDFALMSAKRMLLDRPLVTQDREPYLGGLCVTVSDSEVLLYVDGKTVPITLE